MSKTGEGALTAWVTGIFDVSDTALENIQSPQHSSVTLSSYAFPMPGCFPTKSSMAPRDMIYPLPPWANGKSL